MESPVSSKRNSLSQESKNTRRNLQHQLDETGKGLNRIMDMAQPLLEHQKHLEAQLQAYDLGKDVENQPTVLTHRLDHLQRESDAVLTEFGVNRSSIRATYKDSKQSDSAPNRPQDSSILSPTRMAQSARRARQNMAQGTRPHDIEFATEIGNKLVAEVRAQQQLLAEKDDRIRELLVQLEKRERGFENMQTEVKTALSQAERLKSVNWDLEVALHKADSEVSDLRESEARQAGEAKRLNALIDTKTEQLDAQLATEARLREQLATQESAHTAALADLRGDKDAVKRELEETQNRLDAMAAELEEHQKLSRLRDQNRSPTKQTLENIDSEEEPTTPDRSPRMSPIKGTPSRNVTLEAETLKGSLLSSHRMLQHSRQTAQKEKAEKIELRRQLKEALDELEELKQMHASMMPRRRFMRGPGETERTRPRSGRTVDSKRLTTETIISEEDAGWIEADGSDSDRGIEPDESVYSMPASRVNFSRDGFAFESDLDESSSSPHRQQPDGRRRVLGTHALMSASQVFASSRPLFAELEGKSMAGSSTHSPETVRGASGSNSNTPSKFSMASHADMVDAGTMTTAPWRHTPKHEPITTQFVYEDPANEPDTPRALKSTLTFIQEDPSNAPDLPGTPKASAGPELAFVHERPEDFPSAPTRDISEWRSPQILSPKPVRSLASSAMLPPLRKSEDGFATPLPAISSIKQSAVSGSPLRQSPTKSVASAEGVKEEDRAEQASESVLAKRVIAPLRRKSASLQSLKSRASRESLASSRQATPPPMPSTPMPLLPLPVFETFDRSASPALNKIMVDRGSQPDPVQSSDWHLQNYLAGPAGPQRQFFVYPDAPQPVVESTGRHKPETSNAGIQANSEEFVWRPRTTTTDAKVQATSTSTNAAILARPEQTSTSVQARAETTSAGTDAERKSTTSVEVQATIMSKDVATCMTPEAERFREEHTGMSPKAKRFFGVDVDSKGIQVSTTPSALTAARDTVDTHVIGVTADTVQSSAPKSYFAKHDFSKVAAQVTHPATNGHGAPDSPTLAFEDRDGKLQQAQESARRAASPFANAPPLRASPLPKGSDGGSISSDVAVGEARLRELLRKETELVASQQAIAQLTREKAALLEKPLPAQPPILSSKPASSGKTASSLVSFGHPLERTVDHLRVKGLSAAVEDNDNASDTSCWTPPTANSDAEEESGSDLPFSPYSVHRGKSARESPTAKAERILGKSPEASPMSSKYVSDTMRASQEDVRSGHVMAPPAKPSTARDTLRSRQQSISAERHSGHVALSPTTNDFGSHQGRMTNGDRRSVVRSHSHQSVSSFSTCGSEANARFFASNYQQPNEAAVDADGLDSQTMNAVKRTMIGMSLYKYMRRPGWQGLSDKRHQRFFWLNPYTQTLYWSAFNPVNAPENAVIKSTPVVGLYTEADYNPLPPGIQQRTICIETPTRLLKVTAISSSDHEDWMRALDHLINGSPTSKQQDSIMADFDASPTKKQAQPQEKPQQPLQQPQTHMTAAETPTSTEESSSSTQPFDSQRTVRAHPSRGVGRSTSMNTLGTSISSHVSSIFRSPNRQMTSQKGKYKAGSTPFKKPASRERRPSVQAQSTCASSMHRASRESSVSSLYRLQHGQETGGIGGSGISMDDLADEGLENVRSCCGGKHDVGMLCRRPSSAMSNHR
ncbi:hypothetical protein BCR37DRAFT_398068 [Protomyces lactucae-debilis]|uniref:Pleckstrin homology domain-containing protein n=1 Tax=Protomyces lactucae-debilis TaxID=2754530 RepID=A0A1Y2FM35_PROLT|nr:uncharacterized protein BCR37DRAFT_398068 [Protomyces lactucae-debilis]ORY83835.1 hypothetical protein BCR37DRAFT_398068 [Protomyces lactucae-debilis]